MTCAEFRELAALYTLGALTPEEAAAADAHLEQPEHEGCLDSLQTASAGMVKLARSLPGRRPPPRVWAAIEARVAAVSAPRAAAGMRWRERAAWVAAVAAVMLLGTTLAARQQLLRTNSMLGAASANANGLKDQCLKELASSHAEGDRLRMMVTLLQSPTSQIVSFAPQPGQPPFGARAVVDLAQRKAMVVSASLTPQPGKDFQLWVLRGATPEPAGLLRSDATGTVLASIDPALLAAPFDALAVSVEPAGGSPTGKPTGSVVLVGPLSKS
jgi:anti-sigma-K factor RskA